MLEKQREEFIWDWVIFRSQFGFFKTCFIVFYKNDSKILQEPSLKKLSSKKLSSN